MSNQDQSNINPRHNILKSTDGRIIRIISRNSVSIGNKMAVAEPSSVRLLNVKALPQTGIIPSTIQHETVTKSVKRAIGRNSTSFSSEPPELVVSNVICTFNTRCGIDLRRLARYGRHVELKLGSSICHKKLRDPVCTANVSSTGKITIVGATSLANSYTAARRIGRSLFRMGFPVRFSRYRVVNIFASAYLSFGVDLFSFHSRHVYDDSIFDRREFESEMHAGANYSFIGSSTSFTIFGTGSITLTGSSMETIGADLDRIYPYLMEFATDRPKRPKKVYNGKDKKLKFISKYLQSSSEDESFDSEYTTTEEELDD